ncbi:MAG: glucose-6-phosphate isomerase family protein [Propioniciclava sp.]
MSLDYDPGIEIALPEGALRIDFADQLHHPARVVRTLSEIRASLENPEVLGPEELYAIYMDVAAAGDLALLIRQNLLFGLVRYAAGVVGDEPVRSQGHVHAVSASCGTSTPELYEFWEGAGVVYMQEQVAADPGRCFAVQAGPGDKVLVPPGWAHLTVNAGVRTPMAFGAWCVRDYGFDYSGIPERHGLAWYPKVTGDVITWMPNPHYGVSELTRKKPRIYTEFGISTDAIYRQWQSDPDRMGFVARPAAVSALWQDFVP